MAKPIVMTVDDEPHVLNAIARDLQAHYQQDYRIVKASSGTEALETVQEFKRRNTPVALFLVDQRMPATRTPARSCSPPTPIPTRRSPASTPSISTTT